MKLESRSVQGRIMGRWSKQEERLAVEAGHFRALSELTWSPNTRYNRGNTPQPTDKPRDSQLSINQCGVTNVSFGIWSYWRNLVDLQGIYCAEGAAYDERGAITDDHVWGLFHLKNDVLLHADLAFDQFDGYNTSETGVVLRAINQGSGRSIPHSYEVSIPSRKYPQTPEDVYMRTPTEVSTVNYVARVITPLPEFDTGPFEDRLLTFLGSCASSTSLKFLGQKPLARPISELWLPPDSAHDTQSALDILQTYPCDAQTFLGDPGPR